LARGGSSAGIKKTKAVSAKDAQLNLNVRKIDANKIKNGVFSTDLGRKVIVSNARKLSLVGGGGGSTPVSTGKRGGGGRQIKTVDKGKKKERCLPGCGRR